MTEEQPLDETPAAEDPRDLRRPYEPAADPQPAEADMPATTEEEKERYWQRVLTGNPETVPADVIRQACADDPAVPEEENTYDLLTGINRSWYADHHPEESREELLLRWADVRRSLAEELNVANDEREVFTALADEKPMEERRNLARETYGRAYLAALHGEARPEPSPEVSPEDREHLQNIYRRAEQDAEEKMARVRPLVDVVADGMDAFIATEQEVAPPLSLRVYGDKMRLMEACYRLAEMPQEDRELLYYMAAAKLRKRVKPDSAEPEGFLSTAARSYKRGFTDIGTGLAQGLGHIGVATGRRLGHFLDLPSVNAAADTAEGGLRVLDEIREAAQQDVLPLDLGEGAGLAEQYFVEAMGNVPAAALALCGGVGFGVLGLSGMGQSVSEARRRAPENSQELQLAAGAVGGCVQAGICALMGRVGGKLLEQNLTAFARAHGRGIGAYSLAALRTSGGVAAESGKMLAAVRLGQAAEQGAQELAAQAEQRASNINWQEFGDNLTDIEANMREAAVNLPFVLMGAGKASLHHFRCRRQLLDPQGGAGEWGLKPEELARIAAEPDALRSSEMMREAIRRTPRWNSAQKLLPLARRALNLLNTQQFRPAYSTGELCDFLGMPASFGEGVNPAAPAPARRSLSARLAQNDEWTALARPGEALHLPAQLPPPEKPRACEAAVKQAAEDLQMLAYRRILGAQADGELAAGEAAAGKSELMRRELPDAVSRALVRCAQGELPAYALRDLEGELLGEPTGLHPTARRYLLRRMAAYSDFAATGAEPQMAKQLAVLGARRWAESLYYLLPRCPAFQELLVSGRSPAQAFAELSQRYLGSAACEVPPPAESNAAVFARYSALTGNKVESATGPDGVTRLRARRPDGRYTPWHSTQEQVMNDVAGHAALMFGGYMSTGGMANMRPRVFSRFDQLGALAVHDLYGAWFGSATGWVPGLQIERLRHSMRGAWRGDGITPVLLKEARGPQQYTAELYSVVNPVSMLQARLAAYWRGQIEGGHTTAEQVMDFLAAHDRLTPEERAATESIAALRFRREPGGPRILLPRDFPGMYNEVAGRMAEYMTEYLVQNPDAVPLPGSVRRWLDYAPFMPPEKPAEVSADHKSREVGEKMELLGVDSNRLAARKVQGWAGRAEALRREVSAEDAAFFRQHLQGAFTLPPAQQLEQGWAYRLGGEQAAMATGSTLRRLLTDPGRELSRLSAEDSEHLLPMAESVVRAFPTLAAEGSAPQGAVGQALGNLAAVLAEHPELHEYAPAQEHFRVHRMQVRDLPPAQDPGTFATWATRPVGMKPGYALEENIPMPEWMRQDPRAIPALHTMHALRMMTADGPVYTPMGILTPQGFVGGRYGQNPAPLQGWRSRPALENILRILDEAYAAAGGEPVPVCGVRLRGLNLAELDLRPLRDITVYSSPETSGGCYRLMPGNPEMPSLKVAEPYLVKSFDGILCRGIGGIPAKELRESAPAPESYAVPLRGFVRTRFQPCSEYMAYENTLAATTRAVDEMLALGERCYLAPPDAYLRFALQEGICRLCEDTGFSYFLEGQGVQELSPGQARAVAWVRTMVAALGDPSEESFNAFAQACRSISADEALRQQMVEVFNCERDPADPPPPRKRTRKKNPDNINMLW
ncbi:MAG: hypothetical protein ACI4OZ_09070 [Akkermansia sp.]